MPQPKRKCNPNLDLIAKPSRRIVLPIEVEDYKQCVQDSSAFREWVDAMCAQYPELFPDGFAEGYHLHDQRPSKKMPDVSTRRIRLKSTGAVYRVVPSFVLPYMTGYAATLLLMPSATTRKSRFKLFVARYVSRTLTFPTVFSKPMATLPTHWKGSRWLMQACWRVQVWSQIQPCPFQWTRTL